MSSDWNLNNTAFILTVFSFEKTSGASVIMRELILNGGLDERRGKADLDVSDFFCSALSWLSYPVRI